MTISSKGVKAKILATLEKKPMSVSELSRQMKMRREFITGYLEAMRSEGKVKVVTVGRSKVYSQKR
jgi:predicted transcriptional regulator